MANGLTRSHYGADVAAYYRRFADLSYVDAEPAYHAICHGIAADADLVALVAAHPEEAQNPNVILAAVRYLLLSGLDDESDRSNLKSAHESEHALAAVFAGASKADPVPLFKDIVTNRRDEFDDLVATRRTQTNEVGRSAAIAAGLHHIGKHCQGPLSLIDLGASGGLNLLVDQFRINYRSPAVTRSIGQADSVVVIDADVVGVDDFGDRPLPTIDWRIGVDQSPIDVTDEAEARWLRACVWPSKVRRADRLDSVLSLAGAAPPELIEADAVKGLQMALGQALGDGEVVVTTTWVWFYLPTNVREAVFEVMRTSGRRLWWLSLEAAGVVDGVDSGEPPKGKEPAFSSAIGLWSFDGTGGQSVESLGWAHPHGDWIAWHEPES